jgi:Ca2+-binding RTX toxin-like protein
VRRTILIPVFVAAAVLLVAGAAYARTIDCTDGECEGTNKADTMNGSPRDDKMLVLDGGDTLYGLGGTDMLKGKGGNDKVKGDHGKDRVDGGAGNGLVRGETHGVANDHAHDLLICGPGRDRVYFVRGQDTIKGCEIKRTSN